MLSAITAEQVGQSQHHAFSLSFQTGQPCSPVKEGHRRPRKAAMLGTMFGPLKQRGSSVLSTDSKVGGMAAAR